MGCADGSEPARIERASNHGTIAAVMASASLRFALRRRALRCWAAPGFLLAIASAPAAHADCVDGRPFNVGHRGTGLSDAANPYPENTIPALQAGAQEGATMVEIDVRLSADGVPVIMHDAIVDNTTDGMGCVTALTLDELKLLDAGAGTPMEGQGVQIPTLEEVLDAVDLDMNIELKYGGEGCPDPSYEAIATAVLDVLVADPTPRLQTMSSFELGLLQELRAQDSAVYLGFLVVTPATIMVAIDADFDALNLIDGSVDETSVVAVHDAGLELNVWTVDAPLRIAELFELEVDSIITNEPQQVQAVRDAQCPSEGDTGGSSSGGSSGEPADATGDETSLPGGTDGDASVSASGEASGSEATGGLDEDESGCACRVQRVSPAGAAWWAALGLVGLWHPRRRSRLG